MITRILTLALTAGIAAGAGSAAAALRTPEHGPAGPPGIAGPAGSAGAAGAPGAAAQTAELGVCVNTTFAGTSSYVASVYNLSRRANGTTYCASGTPVDVTPQPDSGSQYD